MLRSVLPDRGGSSRERLRGISRVLKLSSFFFLNPIALVSTFWAITLPGSRVLLFPLLGIVSVLVGAAGAFAAIRILKSPPEKAGSIFTCGSFSNIVTMGGLVAFTMFREEGYALVQLFAILMSPTYYLIGYPVSENIAKGKKRVFRIDTSNVRENPYLLIPLAAITVGVVVRLTGIPRPELLGEIVSILVPCIAGILGFSIGLTLKFSDISSYPREIAAVAVIRHLLVPAVIIPLGASLGFSSVSGGMALKVITIVSCMPVAFNALVPPAIYGFDLDLANSAWIVSTGALVVILPVLFLVL